MAALLRTLDLCGAGTRLAWSLTSKTQLWRLRLVSLSFPSVQPHLYVHLLLQMSNTMSLCLCCSLDQAFLFYGPGTLLRAPTSLASLLRQNQRHPPSTLHSRAQMANH